jgi:hypothetical protein
VGASMRYFKDKEKEEMIRKEEWMPAGVLAVASRLDQSQEE